MVNLSSTRRDAWPMSKDRHSIAAQSRGHQIEAGAIARPQNVRSQSQLAGAPIEILLARTVHRHDLHYASHDRPRCQVSARPTDRAFHAADLCCARQDAYTVLRPGGRLEIAQLAS